MNVPRSGSFAAKGDAVLQPLEITTKGWDCSRFRVQARLAQPIRTVADAGAARDTIRQRGNPTQENANVGGPQSGASRIVSINARSSRLRSSRFRKRRQARLSARG